MVGKKSGVLEHKSGNISETCKDRGKVAMETGEPVGSHKRSFERYHPLLLRPPLPEGSQPHPKTAIAIISRMAKATVYGLQIWLIHSQVHPNTTP